MLIFKSTLCILNDSHLSGVPFANIFIEAVTYLLILLIFSHRTYYESLKLISTLKNKIFKGTNTMLK